MSSLYGDVRARWAQDLDSLRGFAVAVFRRRDELLSADSSQILSQLAGLRVQALRWGPTGPQSAEITALVCQMSRHTLGLDPFPVQVMAVRALLEGRITEMATGEGKSLVAAIAATVAALSGVAVHVVTVNDYLATRDAERHRPLFDALGLSVGCTLPGQTPAQRRAAYAAPVTYCTNKDLVFDHLRDRIATGTRRSLRRRRLQQSLGTGDQKEQPLIPALDFAIVDEADSVLIDEARTPLIISRDAHGERLTVYGEAIAMAAGLERSVHWMLDEPRREVQLTEAGRDALVRRSIEHGPIWQSERMREFLVVQALTALHAYRLDRDYIVRDGKVQIVDEYTGRVLADRSWERGLHQMVEAKEGVELTPERDAIAKMTYQRFFVRYRRLAGMTGTAREVAGELWAVYGLPFVSIPTRRPVNRRAYPTRVFITSGQRWDAVLAATQTALMAGRPVLIGTRSVDASEQLAGRLREAAIEHVVLNARQDRAEADIVAKAGQPGRVTVATNMAGRGTDIVLDPAAVTPGGLHVILTEFHDSARIDRQLFGRASRQGHPGSHEALVSLQDELFKRHLPGWMRRLFSRVWPQGLASGAVGRILQLIAQRSAEALHRKVRLHTLLGDARQRRMMGFAGKAE